MRWLLVNALQDDDRNVRRFSVDALAAIRLSSTVIAATLLRLLSDNDAVVRIKAAAYLGDMGLYNDSGIITAALVDAVKDHEAPVRANALWSLGKLSPEIALPLLLNAITNEAQPVRLRAVISIGEMGRFAASAKASVIVALEDPNESVRRAATNALRRISE